MKLEEKEGRKEGRKGYTGGRRIMKVEEEEGREGGREGGRN